MQELTEDKNFKGQMNRNLDNSYFFAHGFIKSQINISRSFKVIGHGAVEILQVEKRFFRPS